MAQSQTDRSDRANRRYTKRAMAVPLLEEKRELELARRWREESDEGALHEMTTAYMRLVISMATRFRNYGLPHSDLVQEGNVGLMQAAARFDPDRGVRFSTYAGWWIRASIQDYILRNWSIVRTGTTASHKTLFFNLRRLRALIDNGANASLSSQDRIFIAEKLGVGVDDVATMEARLAAGDRSLNAKAGELQGDENALEWQDLLVDERPLPEESAAESHDSQRRSEWIENALTVLNDRELKIIKARQLQEETVTLEALGRELGISKERVRQIEHAALAKLRTELTQMVNDPSEVGLVPL